MVDLGSDGLPVKVVAAFGALPAIISRSERRAVTVPPPLRRCFHRYLLLTKQMRDSGLPADVLVGKLKKDIFFALRRGTIAQVTTHHHALDGYAWLRCLARRRG